MRREWNQREYVNCRPFNHEAAQQLIKSPLATCWTDDEEHEEMSLGRGGGHVCVALVKFIRPIDKGIEHLITGKLVFSGPTRQSMIYHSYLLIDPTLDK